MKIELFLEKLNADNRIKMATKEKYGYLVILNDGYVFGELNMNEVSKNTQQEILKLVDDIVERSEEEFKRIEKIKKIQSEIESEKRWIAWDEGQLRDSQKGIKRWRSYISEYESHIKIYKCKISEDEKEIESCNESISERNQKILELQKQLEEIENQ